jgi:hypothetical protein
LLISFASIGFASGCVSATAPHTGAVATGEQLAVVDDVRVWTTTSREKVAETEYTDANGNAVGKGAVYENRTQVHSKQVWYPVQGAQQLSDEDFFRIADDHNSLEATLRMREEGERANHRGKILLGAGIAASLAGYLIGASMQNYTVEYVGAIGGSAAAMAGWYWASKGARLLDPDAHAVDRSQAERDAQQYNQGHGHTVGLSLSRNF